MILVDDYIVKQEDSKSSRKLYRMICDSCKADRGYQRRSRHGLGLCKTCASSYTHKNKAVSESTRQLMSKNNFIANGGTHPLKGKKHKQETKAKLSRIAARQNKNYISSHPYKGQGGEILMKSSWEVKYATWLDQNGIKWVYEPEFKLSNGYIYLPDFQLSTGDIIEIKGYMREDAQKKWDLFCQDYPKLNKKLVRKEDLKQIGLIK